MEIGIRELRDHLSRYIGQVRNGDEIIVTDRGRAVARVLPVRGERTIDRMIAEGLVTPARSPKRDSERPLEIQGTVSDLVAAQRR